MNIHLSQYHLLKIFFFPHWIFLELLSNVNWAWIYGFISGLSIYLHLSIYLSYVNVCLDYYSITQHFILYVINSSVLCEMNLKRMETMRIVSRSLQQFLWRIHDDMYWCHYRVSKNRQMYFRDRSWRRIAFWEWERETTEINSGCLAQSTRCMKNHLLN